MDDKLSGGKSKIEKSKVEIAAGNHHPPIKAP
jgi:hypothetical protein